MRTISGDGENEMGIVSKTSWYKRIASRGMTVTWTDFRIGWSIDFDGMRLFHLGPLTLYDTSETLPLVTEVYADFILLWLSRSMFHKVDLQVWPSEFKIGFAKGNHSLSIDMGFISIMLQSTVEVETRPTWSILPNRPLFGRWSLF